MAVRSGGITVDVQGLAEAFNLLEEAEEKASDLRPAFRLFDVSVREFTDDQFRTEGAEGGVPWADLLPETWAKRRRSGGNRGGILWDTANLRLNLLNRPLRSFKRQEYRRGTDVPYAGHVAGPETERPMYPEDRDIPVLERALERAVIAHLES